MDEPFAHSDIPLSSTLTVKLSGTGTANQQTFTGRASFERPDASTETWNDTELKGTLTRRLDMSGSYSGRLDINFVKKATARLQITLTNPGGQQLASYDQSVTRSSNFDRTLLLMVVNRAQTGSAASALVSVAARGDDEQPTPSPTGKVAKKSAKKAAKKARKGEQ